MKKEINKFKCYSERDLKEAKALLNLKNTTEAVRELAKVLYTKEPFKLVIRHPPAVEKSKNRFKYINLRCIKNMKPITLHQYVRVQ